MLKSKKAIFAVFLSLIFLTFSVTSDLVAVIPDPFNLNISNTCTNVNPPKKIK